MDLDWDLDWDVEPFRGVYVYIAVSDDLQEWAFRNGRLFLLKIGYSIDPERRVNYLNGKGMRVSGPVRPCLNFTDWRIAGKWPLPHYRSAERTEDRLKSLFARVFEQFDRTEIVKGRRADNGETEIYRLPLRHLPVLPGFFHAPGEKGLLVGQAVEITERAVEVFQRQWVTRLRPSDQWSEDARNRPTSATAALDDIIAQMWEDAEGEAKARESGWPYGDD